MPRSATGLGAKTCAGAVDAAGAAGASTASARAAAMATTGALLICATLAAGLQPQQGDQRLGVAGGGDGAVEVGERPADDLDALVVLGLGVRVAELRGVEEVDDLVHDPDRRDVVGDRLPDRGRSADLLGQLALGRVDGRLALDVEATGRDLQEVRIADRLARLADEEQVGVVVNEHADRALVAHDLALDLLAVGEAEALDPQGDDPALVEGAAPEGLEAAVGGGHAP